MKFVGKELELNGSIKQIESNTDVSADIQRQ
jgi:hypothetical protein